MYKYASIVPVRPVLISTVLVLLLGFSLVACGDDNDSGESNGETAGDLVITDVWSRPAVLLENTDEGMKDETAEEDDSMDDMDMGGTNGVVYMTIENTGEDDRLVEVETDIAGAAELHSVNMVEGVMQMRQVEGGIEIPTGETVVLEPGGLHVMLIGLNRSLDAGDAFEVELTFEAAGSITVESEVREP